MGENGTPADSLSTTTAIDGFIENYGIKMKFVNKYNRFKSTIPCLLRFIGHKQPLAHSVGTNTNTNTNISNEHARNMFIVWQIGYDHNWLSQSRCGIARTFSPIVQLPREKDYFVMVSKFKWQIGSDLVAAPVRKIYIKIHSISWIMSNQW